MEYESELSDSSSDLSTNSPPSRRRLGYAMYNIANYEASASTSTSTSTNSRRSPPVEQSAGPSGASDRGFEVSQRQSGASDPGDEDDQNGDVNNVRLLSIKKQLQN